MASLQSVARKLRLPPSVAMPATRAMAPLYAAILGVLLVYSIGFAQTEEIHNGAHDARHSAGFPCH